MQKFDTGTFRWPDPDLTGLLGSSGLHHCSTTGHGSRRRHLSPDDLPARVRTGADGDRLRTAFPSSNRWPLWRKPEPFTALLSVPVVIKPSPDNIRELYLGSLKELGMDPTIHDIRFVEDNWENPTLGAWGLGWEVWLNGMEVTQFTYFQQVGGLECKPVTGEITYGLERLAMYIRGVDSVYDLVWSDGPLGKTTYGDVFHQNEVEQSTYNFEYADVDFLFTCFEQYEKEAQQLLALETPLPLPAYERILKAAHSFNLLDARKAISVTERQRYILRIRTLTKAVAEAYYASREALGFPMCNKNK